MPGEDGSSSIILPTTKPPWRSQTHCEESLRSNCPLGLTRQHSKVFVTMRRRDGEEEPSSLNNLPEGMGSLTLKSQ